MCRLLSREEGVCAKHLQSSRSSAIVWDGCFGVTRVGNQLSCAKQTPNGLATWVPVFLRMRVGVARAGCAQGEGGKH